MMFILHRLEGEPRARLQGIGKIIKKKALRKPLRPGLTVFSVMIGTFFYCRWLLIILLCHNELKDERGGV